MTKTETEFAFKYSEFVAYSEIIPASKKIEKEYIDKEGSAPSRSGTFKFTETKSFEEALALATDGWDYGLAELSPEEPVEIESGIEIHTDVSGSSVNMGNFLQGLPNNMNRVEQTVDYEYPPLTIYINLTYSCQVKAAAALKHCDDVIATVNRLQTKYNLRIIGVFQTAQTEGKNHRIDVTIKDFDERFVINNIAFAFHPSFYRRLYFAALEGKQYIDKYGYGTVYSDLKTRNTSFEKFDNFGKVAYLNSIHGVNSGTSLEKQIQWKVQK